MTTRPHLLGLLPTDLAAHLRAHGVAVRDGEARRIQAHVIHDAQQGFPESNPVPRAVQRAVDELCDRTPLQVVERAEDPADGFVKYLLRSPDGALHEAVRIPLHKPGTFTVCLSTQVGCAMDCAFCATGRLGLTRNLRAWEIVAAFQAVHREAPGRVGGAVFMGQGEPLLNERAVLQAARVLSDPCGGRIRGDAISVSTVGVVPAIRRYTAAGHPYRLIVSLTSALQGRRDELLPGAARWPLPELADAIHAHATAIHDRVTVAWVLLGGINTGPDEVEALRALLGDVRLRFNLIDVNDPRPGGYRRATPAELQAFRDQLQALGVPVVRRYSGGVSAHAACGMLAARRVT